MKDWSEKWLVAYKKNLEYNTYDMYSKCIHKHIITSTIASIPISKLKTSDLQTFINEKIESGLTRTVEIIRLTLKQLFQQAIENDLIYKNIADNIKIPQFKKAQKRALTDIESRAIFKSDLSPKKRLFVYLALFRSETLRNTCSY